MKETATWLIVDKVPHVVSDGFDGLEVVVVVYTGKGEKRGIRESIVLVIQCQGIGGGAEYRTLHEPGRVLWPPGQLLWTRGRIIEAHSMTEGCTVPSLASVPVEASNCYSLFDREKEQNHGIMLGDKRSRKDFSEWNGGLQG